MTVSRLLGLVLQLFGVRRDPVCVCKVAELRSPVPGAVALVFGGYGGTSLDFSRRIMFPLSARA